MADAYKCDRCGKYVDGTPKERLKFTSGDGVFRPGNPTMSLCPECTQGVKNYLNMMKAIKTVETCNTCIWSVWSTGKNKKCSFAKHCSCCEMYDSTSAEFECKCQSIEPGEPCPYFKENK